ncbi:uncharacterized protein Z520_00988 [Fonsecaea multimorphosa CBS 102226]|uniref:DUF1917 domain-containing protein n=1 Tax=Fonsecaea multimorphosa CBS 102226 TaxID=1442371 RepID=A0A0D2K8X3_9EURO|nr:uncharacterized protein Z520_00988 [Fonsecaea multimorphosa CBS 102226]KIY02523.1 hypothetical protein Z520_00988 [Fonsecaea multimorphosa CBS 102226]OAL31390.1 hypothetical protein AYO22_00982 [Fonsecaea multimorphosa]
MAPASLSSTASNTSDPVAGGHFVAIADADDVFSDESDFHGSLKTKSTYHKLAESYNPQKYWTIHEWSTQVAAARGRERARRHEEAAARHQRAKQLALRNQQEAGQPTRDDNDGPSVQLQQGEGEIRVALDGDGDRVMKIDTRANASAGPEEPDAKVDEDMVDDSRAPRQNFYEGMPSAKQLSESVSEFLTRLPPSTTTPVSARGGPWIWIANPYPPARGKQSRTTSSSPESGGGDVATFRQLGLRLLERYLSRKHELESQNPGKAPGAITRMLPPDRSELESDIRELAKAQGVTDGKWMLFLREEEVDAVWAVVARAVWEGKLGTAAKVATATARGDGEMMVDDDGGKDRGLRLICIYTQDFSDQVDVKRVVQGMKDLGLLNPNLDGPPSAAGTNAALKTIYYKCDAYTHLDLTSGNEYKLKASMYSSRDLFPEWYSASTYTTQRYR